MHDYQLLYRYDEKPPFHKLVLLGLQYLFVVVSWQFVTISILAIANAGQYEKVSVLSTTLIVCGLMTGLQARGVGWFGGKHLMPPSSNPVYTGASMLAVHAGGLPLMYGMILFSGVIEMLASPFIRLLKYILPHKYIGTIIILIGFKVTSLGLVKLVALPHTPHYAANLLLGLFIILFTLMIQVRSQTVLKHLAYLISGLLGTLIYFAINGLQTALGPALIQAAWIQFPSFQAIGQWHFSWQLVIPFVIASLLSVCKVIGSISVLQQIKAEKEIAPEFVNISQANLVDGLGTFVCGLLGGVGINMSSSCTAISLESRLNNKYIAYMTALMIIVVALCGKLMFLLLLTPSLVLGAILMVLGSTLVLYGFKMSLKFIMVDQLVLIIFCLTLMIGLSRGVFIQFYTHLPAFVRVLTESEVVTGTVFIIFSHVMTQVGLKVRKRLRVCA